MSAKQENNEAHLELTVDIVSAYVSKNAVPMADLGSLIAQVSASLVSLERAIEDTAPAPSPAVNPKRSVHGDYIICLEDGKKFKSMKRHLAAHHGMTPDEYRAKWGLPADYPMAAPNYATARSDLAKKTGLGRKPKAPPAPEPSPAGRGRKKKAA